MPSPLLLGVGGEKQKPKSNRPKKKNKLPGVSAHQKSVAEFFSKTTPKIISTSTEPVDSEEYLVCEDVLEREYQLARAARQKLPWCYGMAKLSLYVCDVEPQIVRCAASSEQGSVCEGVSYMEQGMENTHHSGKVRVLPIMNITDIRKHVPGAEELNLTKTTICQSGGEGWVKIDSKMLKGEHRITESQNFSSPTSKKIIQKSRSVASIRKVFASSSDMKGFRGGS